LNDAGAKEFRKELAAALAETAAPGKRGAAWKTLGAPARKGNGNAALLAEDTA
jgi:hypothetical protein